VVRRADDDPPVVALLDPTQDTTVNDLGAYLVKWSVTDNAALASLVVNGEAVAIDPSGTYSLAMELAYGPNAIRIVATDASGNEVVEVVTITLADITKPSVSIEDPSESITVEDQPSYLVKWEATDNVGVVATTINGLAVPLEESNFYSRSVDLVYGENRIEVVASDAAGNTGSQGLYITRVDATKPVVTIASPISGIVVNSDVLDATVTVNVADAVQLASVTIDGATTVMSENGLFEATVDISKMYGDTVIKVVAHDKAGNVSDTLRIGLSRSDVAKPLIMRLPGTMSQTVPYGTNSVTLAWNVVDDAGLAFVSIGGSDATPSGNLYSRNVPLSMGVNKVVFVAQDHAGNRKEDSIFVIRPSAPLGAIAAGGDFGLYMNPSGVVQGWGLTKVPTTLGTVKAIAASDDYGLALDANGGVKVWNSEGVFVEVPEAVKSGVKSIAAGSNMAVAIMALDSSVVIWSVPTGIARTSNIPVGLKAISVAIGDDFCLAIDMDSSLQSWSMSGSGMLPTVSDRNIRLRHISASHGRAIGVTTDNELKIWGDETHYTPNIDRPISRTGMMDGGAGYFHSMARREDGTLVGWGYNGWGQSTPPPSAPTDVVSVSVGYRYTLGIRSDGQLFAWGDNTSKQSTVPSIP
jgi:hypothetical protein